MVRIVGKFYLCDHTLVANLLQAECDQNVAKLNLPTILCNVCARSIIA